MVKLGEMDTDDGKLDDARAALATAAEVARQRLGPQHRVYFSAKTALASVARSQGRWDEARELLVVAADAASGSPRSDALAYRLNLATLDVEMGNHRQAIPALATVTRDMEDLFGGGDTSTITARTWLAAAYFRGGDPDAAQREIDDAYAQAQRSSEPDVAHEVQLVRARQLMRRGRVDSAEPLLRASLAHFETRETSQQPYTERARALLGECLLRRGDLDGALALLSRAAQAQHRIYPQPDVDLWPTELLLALVMQAQGDRPGAEAHYRRALDVVRAVLPPTHPDLHRVQSIAALAAWRHEPSQAHRDELGSALDAYANSLEGRFDSKVFPVLRDGLLVKQPEAEMSIHDIVSLLND
jgi:eukaryotic-like serine/threonine-protein kinase